MKNLFTSTLVIFTLSSFTYLSEKNTSSVCDWTCPEDEYYCLYNTNKIYTNQYGKNFYIWQCPGDSDHQFLQKIR